MSTVSVTLPWVRVAGCPLGRLTSLSRACLPAGQPASLEHGGCDNTGHDATRSGWTRPSRHPLNSLSAFPHFYYDSLHQREEKNKLPLDRAGKGACLPNLRGGNHLCQGQITLLKVDV